MSTLLSGEGFGTVTVLGMLLAGGGATFLAWCALRMGAEVERAEAIGLVRRPHDGR